jgi:hypothetical protein
MLNLYIYKVIVATIQLLFTPHRHSLSGKFVIISAKLLHSA